MHAMQVLEENKDSKYYTHLYNLLNNGRLVCENAAGELVDKQVLFHRIIENIRGSN